MSAVETLREAARLMRERAEADDVAGRWEPKVLDDGRAWVLGEDTALSMHGYSASAAHIAALDPTVALALADWLDEHDEIHSIYDCQYEPCAAITFARTYLRIGDPA